VALLAGLQAGAIADLKDLVPNRTEDSSVFEPLQTLEQRQSCRQRWNDAVSRSLHWNG
jgi:glycerol kinase